MEAKKKLERESECTARLQESIKITRRKYEVLRKSSTIQRPQIAQSLWVGYGNVVHCEFIENAIVVVTESGHITCWCIGQYSEGSANETFKMCDIITLQLKDKKVSDDELEKYNDVSGEPLLDVEGNLNLPQDLQDIKKKKEKHLFVGDEVTCAVIKSDKKAIGVDVKLFIGLSSGKGVDYTFSLKQPLNSKECFFKQGEAIQLYAFMTLGLLIALSTKRASCC